MRALALGAVVGLWGLTACSGAAPGGVSTPERPQPVIDSDFPDPHIVRDGSWWYAFATGVVGVTNLQVARSRDLRRWELLGEALPERPDWQPLEAGLTWAPEVLPAGGRWVMHYTARDADSGLQCLSTAVADSPEGPYIDDSTGPLVCQRRLGGSIDSHPFTDADGSRWLFWKNDGNARGLDTRIWVQRLGEDGRSVVGRAHDTGLRQKAAWHGALVEAPTVLRTDAGYLMFYSANGYDTGDYAVGWASADRVTGPYRDQSPRPWLGSDDRAVGPGGQTVVAMPDDRLMLAYHAWSPDRVGYAAAGQRSMWLRELQVVDGRPVLLDLAVPARP